MTRACGYGSFCFRAGVVRFASREGPARSQIAPSSRVRARESDLIAGAATTTSGNIVAQETSQDTTQFRKKVPADNDGTLAIPAAISDVNPDWMTPKTKWL